MSKHIQLTIPEPCHENWDAMSPVEKGKFCGSCQKQVVDFSTMSDRDIAEFFKKPSTGSVCGRFMTDQLDRNIEIPKKRIPWLKYFFQIALPALFVSKAAAQTPHKMGKIAVPKKDTIRIPVNQEIRMLGMVLPQTIVPVIKEECTVIKGEVVSKKKVVQGKIVDPEGNPVPAAYVRIINNGVMLTANDLGGFSISEGLQEGLLELEVSSVGYKTEYFRYPVTFNSNQPVDITVQLTPAPKDLTEIIVTAYEHYTIGKVVTGSVTKVDSIVVPAKQILNEPVASMNKILVYPNPVTPGATINISFKEHDEGYYQLEFHSQGGQLVKQQEIWIDKAATVLNIQVPAVSAGTYFVRLVNRATNKSYTEKIIIL